MKYPFKHAALGLFTLLLFLTACKTDAPGSTPDDSAANPAKLSAAVSKNYTVSLNWNALSGSARLERKVKESEADFATIADVTGQTSFEDFPVLDKLFYTYRLTTEAGQSEVSLEVPAVAPNPRKVSLTLEGSTAATQSIGVEGGTLTTTGADGTVYTLELPANALLKATDITLTPISNIADLPLSGGLLGAVQITPEIELYDYATLTIKPVKATPAGLKRLGFMTTNTGAEFHLRGLSNTPVSAVIQPQQDDADTPLIPLVIDTLTTVGVGTGTPEDVATQVQSHPPTDGANQAAQSVSDTELPPLIPPRGQRISNDLNTQGATPQVFREYRQWLESLRQKGLEAEFDATIKRVSKQMADKISSRFDELFQKCEQDPSVVKEMQSLVSWASKYPALVQNLGQAWFSEASDRAKLCQPGRWEGTFNSTTGKGSPLQYDITANLIWTYEGKDENGWLLYRPSGEVSLVYKSTTVCTYTASNEVIDTDKDYNFLKIDYSSTPPKYGFDFRVKHSQTFTCPGVPANTLSVILDGAWNDLNNVLSNNNTEITGSRSFFIEGYEYSSSYSFTKIVE
jgi:hypothetical protein